MDGWAGYVWCGGDEYGAPIYSSTCSTEFTISFTISFVKPGMTSSASVNARCKLLSAIRASGVATLGNNYHSSISITQ